MLVETGRLGDQVVGQRDLLGTESALHDGGRHPVEELHAVVGLAGLHVLNRRKRLCEAT